MIDDSTVDTERVGDEGENNEEYDERFTDEYYRWKKNAPLLYDTVFTQSLAW
jgi:hypothetical protein